MIEATLERIATALEGILEALDPSDSSSSTNTAKSTGNGSTEDTGKSGKSGSEKAPSTSSKKSSGKTSKASPGKKKPSKGSSKETELTKDDVREALRKVNAARSSDVGRQLVKDHGGNTLTDLDPGTYASLIAACEEACDG